MVTQGPDVQISPMTAAEVAQIVAWARVEGWMPSQGDAEVFGSEDPRGFLAARVAGEMVAGISCVRWGCDYAFLGLFITQPQWRSQGIGGVLFRAALEHAGDRLVGLDGVPAQVGYYQRMGLRTAHLHVRYASAPGTRLETVGAGAGDGAPGFTLLAGSPDLLGAAVGYDAQFFPGDRREFMARWLDPNCPWRRWLAAVDPQGRVVGLGVVRDAPPGYKVGPLHAEHPVIADALFRALAGQLPGPVMLDVPEVNPAAVELVTRYAMSPVFQCARMYRDPAPALPLERNYGVCTLELG